jgi:hypothetical protein
MGTLSGQKVKDAFPSLLKLETNTATSTPKVIEDGSGNDTALKLGTTAVEVNGELRFTAAPAVDATELTALLFDGTKVVTRDLGTNAFTSSTITYTAFAPITLSSFTFGLEVGTSLSALNDATVAGNDVFMIYDVTGTQWKGFSLTSLTTYLQNNLTFISTAGGSNTQIQYNSSGALAGASNFTMSTSAGSEQLQWSGLEFILRETQSGNAALFRRAVSATIGGGFSNFTVFSPQYANFKGVKIEYVLYNNTESTKRIGTIRIIWTSSTGTNVTIDEDIHTFYGASTASTLVFNATTSGSQLLLRATNTSGETQNLRMDCKLFYSY